MGRAIPGNRNERVGVPTRNKLYIVIANGSPTNVISNLYTRLNAEMTMAHEILYATRMGRPIMGNRSERVRVPTLNKRYI
jgi:hypothetical protein